MTWEFPKSEDPRRKPSEEEPSESSENTESSSRNLGVPDDPDPDSGLNEPLSPDPDSEDIADEVEIDESTPSDRVGFFDHGPEDLPLPIPRLGPPRRRGKRLTKKPETPREPLSPAQRLLILDTWRRSGLPAADFSVLVGVSKHTLYAWRKRFKERGPAGLEDRKRKGPRGSRLPEITKRAILMMKEEHPDWGTQRISDMLFRGPALGASPSAVARVLHEAGYELEEIPTRPHPDRVRRFERARPNELWQTDLFTFVLKRQNRRVYLVAFMDDHSRFIVGWGLSPTQLAGPVLEVLRSAITNYNTPKEILTDNGAQYVTWRGKSKFSRELDSRGIRHIVATPRRPQTLGKVERFWGTLWREFLETAIFLDLEDARARLDHFVSYYNFFRPHQGIAGLTPSDRFFESAPKVLEMLKARVKKNALDIARHGEPKKSFYLTGQIEGKSVSVRTEGDRVVVEREGEEREEVELEGGDLPPGVCGLDHESSSPALPINTSSGEDGEHERDGDLEDLEDLYGEEGGADD